MTRTWVLLFPHEPNRLSLQPPSTPPINSRTDKRNKAGTLLILYDQNDGAPALAAAMATELVLRGWENVYVLSGGKS
jgi:hypothetical protein